MTTSTAARTPGPETVYVPGKGNIVLHRTTWSSVFYAQSRTHSGITYRITNATTPSATCECPARGHCAHLAAVAILLFEDEKRRLATPPPASIRKPKEEPMQAQESPHTTALTMVPLRPELALQRDLDDENKLALLRDTLTTGLTNAEFALFVQTAKTTGLNPFQRQIHAMKHGGKNPKMSIITGIDGYRLIAQRTGEYDGQDGPYWCGQDGVWREVWTSPEPPVAAKVVVFRKGVTRGFTGIANYDAYVQTTRDFNSGETGPNSIWKKMPANQTAKCAEALALRKAFPAEMSNLYTDDEMGQAYNDEPSPRQQAERWADEDPGPYGGEPEPPKPAKEKWPWGPEFHAALIDSPWTLDDVYAFLDCTRETVGRTVDAWLTREQATPAGLMSAIGRWVENGRRHAEPEAEYREVEEPRDTLFDMPDPVAEPAQPGRHG